VCDTTLSSSPCRRIAEMWTSSLHNFFRVSLGNYKDIYLPKLRIYLCASRHNTIFTFSTIAQLVKARVRITSSITFGDLRPQPESSSATVPSLTLAIVMYVYVILRPFEIWLRLRSPISLSIFRSSGLHIGRCFTSMFTRQSPLVPDYRLVPSDLSLRCIIARDLRCEFSKGFHYECVPPSKRFWGTLEVEHCDSYEDVVATLLSERDRWWWYAFGDGPYSSLRNVCWSRRDLTLQNVWTYRTIRALFIMVYLCRLVTNWNIFLIFA